jgi:hypothetical protein
MDAEVISFAERRRSRHHPILDRVHAYWDGLRNGRDAPSRAEINPRGLPDVLRHCFILERIAPGLGRFRVAGQHLCDIMGMELVGLPISAVILPESRDSFEASMEQVFSDKCTARLTVVSPEGIGRNRIEGQILLLPLRDDLGHVTRILGCLAIDGDPGRPPRRLEITHTAIRDTARFRAPIFPPASDAPSAQHTGSRAQVIDLRVPTE